MAIKIGITGGIGSGKSVVSRLLEIMGIPVYISDIEAKRITHTNDVIRRELCALVGQDVFLNGELNRPKLGQLIFSNEEMRHRSAEIQGTIIRKELATQRDCLAKKEDVFFMDIPLLIENGYQDWFDQIWLVAVLPEVQRQRLMKRNHLSFEEAKMRIDSQISLEEKKPYASLVLDNNASLDDLKEKVKSAINDLPSSS